MIATGIAGIAFLWIAFASANVMFRDEVIEAKNSEIEALDRKSTRLNSSH